MTKIRVAIWGYGNLGHAVEESLVRTQNVELVCIFSHRNSVTSPHSTVIENTKNILGYKDKLDLICICSGSYSSAYDDILYLSKYFDTISSFDTHSLIPEIYQKLKSITTSNNTFSILSVGWDPGLFSCARTVFYSFLQTTPYCFWGKGTSLGHTEAAKSVSGVKDALSVTIPIHGATSLAKQGIAPPKPLHKRLVYVLPETTANTTQLAKQIKSIPNYFAGERTTVRFVSKVELDNLKSLSHAGNVICMSDDDTLLELNAKMASNPSFTAKIMTAYVRVKSRLKQKYGCGAFTPLHFSPIDLSPESELDTIKKFC